MVCSPHPPNRSSDTASRVIDGDDRRPGRRHLGTNASAEPDVVATGA